MNKCTTWMLAAAMAAGSGCVTAQPAQAQATPAPAAADPMAVEQQRAAEAAQAAHRDAMRAGDDARKAAAEVRAKIRASGLGNGVNVYARKVKKEKAAYLGVSTSSVPGALREQMKLQRGFGLVVDTVEEESSAGVAGIKQFDILQKLNDQLLVNTQQLSVLVRAMKPGEKVSVTLLRGGQPMTVDVTLQEKELPVLGEAGGLDRLAVGMPLAEWTGTTSFPEVAELHLPPDGAANLVDVFGVDDDKGSSVYSDSEMTLTITTDDDEKTLLAKDAQGATLFEGPISTEEQKKALPQKVAEKLAKFEARIGTMNVDGKKVRVRVIEP